MREAIEHLKSADPVLGGLIDALGPFGMRYLEPNYDALVRAIIYQQLSGRVAGVIFDRLSCACGCPVSPESLLSLRPDRMRRLGLSRPKVVYLRELARLIRDRKLELEGLERLPDEDVCRVLTAIKGIGTWTVQMYLMFALRRLDVLPVADLGIQAAIQKAYGLASRPTPADVAELGRKWSPYATVASWYLWKSVDGKGGF